MLDLNASTLDGPGGPVLTVRWTYAADLLGTDRVRALSDRFTAALTELVRRTGEPGFAGHSPGDFAVALRQEEITELEADHPALDGVLPLTPLQHGLAYHALTEPGTGPDVYAVQLELEISGPLEPARLHRAARTVVDRHANLRAGFRRLSTGHLVQYTTADAAPEWTEHDIRERPDALAGLVADDRVRRFDPDRPPLLRFTLIRTADDRWRLLFTSHHLLLDGWSSPLFLTDLFDAYAGQPPVRRRPFAEYAHWITTRDRAAAEAAWRTALAGITRPTLVAPAAPATAVTIPEETGTQLDAGLTSALQEYARAEGTTLNTVVQAGGGSSSPASPAATTWSSAAPSPAAPLNSTVWKGCWASSSTPCPPAYGPTPPARSVRRSPICTPARSPCSTTSTSDWPTSSGCCPCRCCWTP